MDKKNTLTSLHALVGTRDILIYGAGPRGYIWYNYLRYHAFNVAGFIDRSKKGANIHSPAILERLEGPEKPFIIIAAQATYVTDIRKMLERCGFEKEKDYLNGAQLYNRFPTIEVSGICNLQCISCNLGSPFPGRKKGGLMSMGLYRDIFAKLNAEIPILPNLALYCWGEPLLNPELPDMIAFTQGSGVSVELSTNLNYVSTLESVIETSPTFLKVSCSGAGDHYEKMHTGGTWSAFRDNLHNLRGCIDRVGAATKVEIEYHVYKNNLGEDFDTIKGLADELGFLFNPIIANVFPERIYNYMVDDTPIPDKMQEASSEMLYSIEDQIAYSQAHRGTCQYINAFPTIRWDGSVLPCCNMEGGEIAQNYLDVPLDELKKRQLASDLCKKCLAHGLQRLCSTNGKIEIVNGMRTMVKL